MIIVDCSGCCVVIEELVYMVGRDVTNSESVSKSDGIWHFFGNPKSDGYLKSDCVRFKIANC